MTKKLIAACAAAATLAALGATPALATTTADVRVRIEGTQHTVFDGVVRASPRSLGAGTGVQATSDDEPRTCDGTNNDMNPAPGPTATGASVTAMDTLGASFDGNWTPGFDDYFITAFGDERDSNSNGWWWGILVNRLFTPVGGCQYQVVDGDEVLWVNDAFQSRPFLWAAPLGGASAGDAVVGEPYAVSVGTSVPSVPEGSQIGDLAPEDPYEGATVSQVDLTGNVVAAPSVAPATTTGSGIASLTFTQPGWHRVKARHQNGSDHPIAIASNSVDVCVRATAAAPTCEGPAPSQVPVNVAPGTQTPGTQNPGTQTPGTQQPGTQAPPAQTPLDAGTPTTLGAGPQLTTPSFDRTGDRTGRIGLRWSITAPGVGVARWTAESRLSSAAESGPWTPRAAGTTQTAAALRLPGGVRSDVRFSVTDNAGRTATTNVGDVLVPLDDRARAFKRGRGWTQQRDAKAWMGSYSVGGKGKSLKVKLAAGKPTVFIRGVRKTAIVELRSGGRTERFRIKASKSAGTRELTLSRAAKAGTLTVRIIKGSVGIDGVAAG